MSEYDALCDKLSALRAEIKSLSKRKNRLKALDRYYQTHTRKLVMPLSKKNKTPEEYRRSVNEYQKRWTKKKLFHVEGVPNNNLLSNIKIDNNK